MISFIESEGSLPGMQAWVKAPDVLVKAQGPPKHCLHSGHLTSVPSGDVPIETIGRASKIGSKVAEVCNAARAGAGCIGIPDLFLRPFGVGNPIHHSLVAH
eukprot:scaffold1764_cov318-Pavlova_lutheri.AAC.1